MNVYSLTKTSLKSMLSNKVRTFLTVLGMVIGIMSIIIVFSAGEGINRLFVNEINSFGTDIVETEVKVPSNKVKGSADIGGAMSMAMGTQITTLTLDDLEKINQLPNVKNGYGAVLGQDLVTFGNERKKITMFGTNASYIDIDRTKIAEGRFFSETEDRALAKVVIIGAKIKKDLFGDNSAVGQEIKIGKLKYEVIGVAEERGGGFGLDFDSYVYVPIRTLQKRITGANHLMYTISQLKDPSRADETADEIRALLRQRHNIEPNIDPATGQADTSKDDFRVTTMEEMMKIMKTVTNAVTILLLAIVIISLLVGGVGVMNIMYVVVSERTAEIGLRKAVGARYHDIMGQFLIEAVLITIIGAIIGIGLGAGISYFIAVGAKSQGLKWDFAIPLKAYLVAVSFSVICGLVFGLMPARRAARLDPIVALRNE
jgi:ABC-type antimicrobial peptide transport system permease subunit